MKRNSNFLLFSALAILFVARGNTLAQTTGIHLVKKTVIGGEGGWDYLTVDGKNRRLYVSHSTQVEVLDADTHKPVGVIPNTKGIHGIAVIPSLGLGITTNGKTNTATFFELTTLKAVQEIPTGNKPDALLYDKFSNRIFIFNNDGASVTVIDPVEKKVVGTLDLGGAPEAGVSDENGLIYVNLEDKNEVLVFEAKTLTIKNRWTLAPGEEPTGLALDKKNHRLFSVCHNEFMIILDSDNGTLISKLPIGKRVDGVVFDPSYKLAMCSNGEGTITVIREVTSADFKVVETIKTMPGAKTIALDSKTHHLFLSTAEYGAAPKATQENPNPKPTVTPGTFMVLEFGGEDE
jgi:DNA-binding beta-propeller fold protein YncE